MKLVKTSAIAFALSAMLAGPVLAQGASSDTQIRGGAQGRSNMQGGASGSGDEEFNAQPGARRKGRRQREGRRERHCRGRQRSAQGHRRCGWRSRGRRQTLLADPEKYALGLDPRVGTGFPSGQTRSVCPKIVLHQKDEIMNRFNLFGS